MHRLTRRIMDEWNKRSEILRIDITRQQGNDAHQQKREQDRYGNNHLNAGGFRKSRDAGLRKR